MLIQEIMSRRVVSVGMDATLEHIRRIFEHTGFHHITVVDLNTREFAGIISDRDLYQHISPFLGTMAEQERDRLTLKKKAYQIMTRKPLSASPEDTVEEGAKLLLANNISCLPVLSPRSEVVGIVTWKDILRALLKLDVGVRNSANSEPRP
ncbi:MAG: CBS domain-containing protein [Bacillota bacterium]